MKTYKISDIITAKDSSQVSLDDLRQQIGAMAAEDARFKIETEKSQCVSGPWVDNIIFDDGEWSAILCNAGKLWEVGFKVKDAKITKLSDDAKEVKRKTAYVAATEPFKFNGSAVKKEDGEIINASGIEEPESEVVQCKDSGSPLSAEKKWEFGKPVEFMWAPGGKTVIQAGCGGRTLRLWVIGDEAGAKSVQSSFVSAVAASPRRLPFGCIEHEEKERAFDPKGFAWKKEPEPGIYCSAIPTKLGEANVNGKLQDSFSPCFRHDAKISKSVCMDCSEASSVCKCDGILEFPEGVRGSESNPARFVGISEKSVGSLTNWPAFKNILHVTAKEPEKKPTAKKSKIEEVKDHALTAFEKGAMAEFEPANKAHSEESSKAAEAASSKVEKVDEDSKGEAHMWAGKAHLAANLAHSKTGGNWKEEYHHRNQADLHGRYSRACCDEKSLDHSRAMNFKASEKTEAGIDVVYATCKPLKTAADFLKPIGRIEKFASRDANGKPAIR